MDIKAGDKVICINDSFAHTSIKKGREYDVAIITHLEEYVFIKLDGVKGRFVPTRFKKKEG